jgi:hypothetical protein
MLFDFFEISTWFIPHLKGYLKYTAKLYKRELKKEKQAHKKTKKEMKNKC